MNESIVDTLVSAQEPGKRRKCGQDDRQEFRNRGMNVHNALGDGAGRLRTNHVQQNVNHFIDADATASLPPLDAIADTVGPKTAEALIAKVKPGDGYSSVVGAPGNAQ